MYLRREKLDDEPRALLALAMHKLNIMPAEKKQLAREIDRPVKEKAFDPETFSSTARVDAIRALALASIGVEGVGQRSLTNLRSKISEWLDSSQSLSTQENFWLLMAFKTMHAPVAERAVDFRAAQPVPTAISRNSASASWSKVDIRRVQEFAVQLQGSDSLTCQILAEYRSDSPVTDRNDRGFRVERVVRNLTDKDRAGTAQSPFRLGDQILITYRLISPKLHHYVALDSELPGGLETVNPNIASIARTYSVPQEKDTSQLSLSYSELRDRTTCLYFDRVEPGVGSYSVLARATSAGVFHWPATQVTPMYDSRFSGLSPSSLCLRGRRVARVFRRFAATTAVFSAVAALTFAWFVYLAPLPSALQKSQRPLTTIYLDANRRLIAELAGDGARSHRPIPLGEMGPWLPKVTISLEDQRFYDHRGVDLRASLRALVRRRGGGSTITQQFVKVATGRSGRSIWAKAKEALFALQLEQRWTKAQILEAYLNTIPYGNRLIGAEAAAQAYFQKPAAMLTQAEAIYLAGLPREPSRLNPWTQPDRAARQFRRSLQLLVRHGNLGPAEVNAISCQAFNATCRRTRRHTLFKPCHKCRSAGSFTALSIWISSDGPSNWCANTSIPCTARIFRRLPWL
jgi:hypothetical protein